MQYRSGTITITNGSAVVNGSGTEWLSRVRSGSLFALPGQEGTYTVLSVQSDTQLTLTTPWQGATITDARYWITTDFTPFHNLPIAQPNDLDSTKVLERALVMIDQKLSGAPMGLFAVLDKDLTAPPLNPVVGAAYIVPAGSVGSWEGKAGKIALYQQGAWLFFTPSNGAWLKVIDEGKFYFFDSATNAWAVNPLAAEAQTKVSKSGDTMTGPLRMPSGAFNAPSITFASDPDTGIYRVGPDVMGVAVGGSQAIEVRRTGSLNETVIRGDLIVEGRQVIQNTTVVEIDDNILLLNKDVAGTPTENSGIEIERGIETNAQFVWDETADHFRAGLVGSLQAVATRQDAPVLGGIAYWNNVAKRFDTVAGLTWNGTILSGNLGGVFTGTVTGLQTALDAKLNASAYTAADVLTKLKTVDGSGSGLDADFLRGWTADQLRSWSNLTGVPTTFTPSAHTHVIADVTGLQTALDDLSGQIGSIQLSWDNITGKPTTFTPSAHTHAMADVTGLTAALGAKVNSTDFTWDNLSGKPTTFATTWAQVSGKPTTFAPSAHTHAISEVTGLQTALDAKLASASFTWANLGGKPTTFAPAAHTHAISEVTGLQTALDDKASLTGNVSFSGSISGVSSFNLSNGAGTNRLFRLQTGALSRWAIYADSSAESGANAGSFLRIARYDDAGAQIDVPFIMSRATGRLSLTVRPTFDGATPWDSANFDPATKASLTGGRLVGYQFAMNSDLDSDGCPWYGWGWKDNVQRLRGYYGITIGSSGATLAVNQDNITTNGVPFNVGGVLNPNGGVTMTSGDSGTGKVFRNYYSSQNTNTTTAIAQFRRGESSHTGAIVFRSPSANTSRYFMTRMKIEGYLYSTNNEIDFDLGFYTYGNPDAFYNTTVNHKTPNRPKVRLAYDAQGRTCIIIGDVNTVWSYPHLAITRAMFSHTNNPAFFEGWTSGSVTTLSEFVFMTADLTLADIGTAKWNVQESAVADSIVKRNGSGYVYASWFGASSGLFNPGSGVHMRLDVSGGLRHQSGQAGYSEIGLQTNDAVNRGFVYANSNNQVGFLSHTGNWKLNAGAQGGGSLNFTGAPSWASLALFNEGGTGLGQYYSDGDAANMGLLNSAGSWRLRHNPSNGLFTTIGGTERSVFHSGADLRMDRIRNGLVGVYDAAQTQAIFAMGPAYTLTDGGGSANIGNFYGLGWSYNPDYGAAGNNPQSKAGLNHQMLLMNAGVTQTAIGSGIWTNGHLTFNPVSTSGNINNILNANFQAVAGNGIRFWGGDSGYSIYMSDAGNSTWGGRGWNEGASDYNIYFRNRGYAARGFVFKCDEYGVIASLNQGHIHLSGGVQAAGASNFNGQVNFNGGLVYNSNWWRSTGATGWFNDTYSVGIYATQAGEVRTYNGARFNAEGGLWSAGVRVPTTTYSQAAPSGGVDGDVHIVW